MDTEYRAVIKYATSDGRLVNLTSDWLLDRDQAEEIIENFGPYDEGWDGLYGADIERKEIETREGETDN